MVLLGSVDGCLRSGETGNGYTEGAAGNVVQANLVAEFHGGRIAAVLAANADVQLGVVGTAQSAGHVHQLANTGLVQLGEGIVLEDLGIVVSIQELTGTDESNAAAAFGEVYGEIVK